MARTPTTTKSRSLTLVFVASALLVSLAFVPAEVAALENGFNAHRPRHHNTAERMIKKRLPALDIPGLTPASVGNNPNATESAAASSSTASSASSTSAAVSTTSASISLPITTTSASASATTTAGNIIDSLTAGLGSLTASSASSTPVSSTSSTISSTSSASSTASSVQISFTSLPSSSAPASTTPPPPAQAQQTTASPTAKGTTTQIVIISGSAAAPTQSADTSSAAASNQPSVIAKKTIAVIAAIAGSVGLAFLIWTGIRKWKFRPSKRFDERMAPIDWQPTNDRDDPSERAVHRRQGSAGSHGSFGSSEMHGGQAGGLSRSVSGHSAVRPRDDVLPPHDFTAGAADIAPGPAYSDLQRGAPPQMMEAGGAGLTRGPSMMHGNVAAEDPYGGYNDYGTTAPHQGYNTNPAAYGAAPDHGYGAPYRGY